MKTALQDFIQMVHTCKNQSPNQLFTWDEIIEAATDYLPTERKQIEKAYDDGAYDMAKGEFGGIPEYRNANDYYNKTYGNEI